MGTHDAIIPPVPGKHPVSIGSRCAMVANPLDVECLCGFLGLPKKNSRRLLLSRLYYNPESDPAFGVIGPFIGSPYAVMLLETAISWGVKEIVFIGWCGAVSSAIHIGDIIIPDAAFIDEGTSKDYISTEGLEVGPFPFFQDRLKQKMHQKNIKFHEGPVWSTDAIFRETPEKVAYYQGKNVLAVDMETSAFFSVSCFRSVPVGCVLVVSDELSSGKWIQGFHHPEFKKSRNQVCEVIHNFLKE